jgi:uncharacterized protein YehS (DUF1456 family)
MADSGLECTSMPFSHALRLSLLPKRQL